MKRQADDDFVFLDSQPPSGGCVLRHYSIFGCKTGGSKCPPTETGILRITFYVWRLYVSMRFQAASGCETRGQQVPTLRKSALCVSHFIYGGCTYPCGSGCLRMQNGWTASAHPTEPALAALSRICVTCFYCANKSFRASDMVGWVNIWLRT